MTSADAGLFKSAIKRFVNFFPRSRERWKTKYVSKGVEKIALANRAWAIVKRYRLWRGLPERAIFDPVKPARELCELGMERTNVTQDA